MMTDHTDDLREHLIAQGLSVATVRNYLMRFASFAAWCEAEGLDPATVAPSEIARYQAGVLEDFSYSYHRHLRCVLTHFWELVGRDRAPVKAIRVPPKPRFRWRGFEPTDAAKLVKVSRGWHPEGTATLFGLYLALRVSEIARARWDRFDPEMDWYRVTGKGDVTDTLPVHPILVAELAAVPQESPWIFPSDLREEGYVNRATVWSWVKRVAEEAGLGDVTTHQLRHTALAMVNDELGDLRAAMMFARHTRPDVTASYTRTTNERMREVALSLCYTDYL